MHERAAGNERPRPACGKLDEGFATTTPFATQGGRQPGRLASQSTHALYILDRPCRHGHMLGCLGLGLGLGHGRTCRRHRRGSTCLGRNVCSTGITCVSRTNRVSGATCLGRAICSVCTIGNSRPACISHATCRGRTICITGISRIGRVARRSSAGGRPRRLAARGCEPRLDRPDVV
jgi:hypothetical protein